ncbi:e14 prophage; predicted integrase [Escherichia coli]|nr:e14 prophage; predicted integrase [Escherichia coli]
MLWEQTKLKLSLLPLRPTLAWLNKEPGRFWLSVTGSQPERKTSTWLDRYQAIQDDRLKSGDIRLNTYKKKLNQYPCSENEQE